MSVVLTRGAKLNAGVGLSYVAPSPFSSDGASLPFNSQLEGPSHFYDTVNGKLWLSWEMGIAALNKRLVAVRTYTPSTNTWSNEYIAGIHTLTGDPHGVPSQFVVGGYSFIMYGAHDTPMHVISTVNANDPSVWQRQPDVPMSPSGTGSAGAADATKIYFVSNNKAPSSPPGPSSRDAALVLYVGTPSGGDISWAAQQTLCDAYNGVVGGPSVGGFLPICMAVNSPDGTEVLILFSYGPDIDLTAFQTHLCILRYVKANGNIKNWAGTYTVTPASQPVLLADIQANFAIQTGGNFGMPTFEVDAAGAVHVMFSKGIDHFNCTLQHITAVVGGAWSSPTTVYTFPVGVDAMLVNGTAVRNGSGGIDVMYPDGALHDLYTFPLAGGNGATGNIIRSRRSSGGVWTGPFMVQKYNGVYGLDCASAVVNNTASARFAFCESTYDYTTMSGALRSYVNSDSGNIAAPATTVIDGSQVGFDGPRSDLTQGALSNRDLTVTKTVGVPFPCMMRSEAQRVTGGKYFWKMTVVNDVVRDANFSVGLTTGYAQANTWQTPNGLGWFDDGTLWRSGGLLATIGSYTVGDVLSLAWDVDGMLFWGRVNTDNWNASGTAVPGTSGGISLSYMTLPAGPVAALYRIGDSVTADFKATPPSGFVNLTNY